MTSLSSGLEGPAWAQALRQTNATPAQDIVRHRMRMAPSARHAIWSARSRQRDGAIRSYQRRRVGISPLKYSAESM
jgi:hypothetical protein